MTSPWLPLHLALSLPIAAGNLFFWWRVVRGDPRFRERMARAFGVEIDMGSRGHWSVRGDVPLLRRLGIEMLQLAYYMGAFVVWAVGMVLAVLLMRVIPS
jgi:hypothetical protein